jgi:hypothetical protein
MRDLTNGIVELGIIILLLLTVAISTAALSQLFGS